MRTIVDFLLDGLKLDEELREAIVAKWKKLRVSGTSRNERGIVVTTPDGATLQLTDEAPQQVVGTSPTINFFAESPPQSGMPTVGPSGPTISFSPGEESDAGQE